MGSFKDLETFKRNLGRAHDQIESASYSAGQAQSEASDASDEAENAAGIISGLMDEVEGLLDFDTHDIRNAIRNIMTMQKVFHMYVNRLDNLMNGTEDNDRRYADLISIVDRMTTSSFGQPNEIRWDTGYEVSTDWVDGQYVYSVKAVKEDANV
jgi:Tfp pilus assembly protein PilW